MSDKLPYSVIALRGKSAAQLDKLAKKFIRTKTNYVEFLLDQEYKVNFPDEPIDEETNKKSSEKKS